MTNLTNLSDEALALLTEQTFLQLDTLRDRYVEIGEQIMPVYESHRALLEEVDRRKIVAFDDSPEWEFLLEETGGTSSARYKAANAAIATLSGNLSFSGYAPTLNQRHVCVSLEKKEDVTSCLKGLETLLPFLKYRADEDGSSIHRIGVTSNDLSASGVLYLILFEGEPRVELRKLVYGSTRLLEKFDSLENALKYVAMEHYYDHS